MAKNRPAPEKQELIAALASPPGGALGIVRLSGCGAQNAALSFLKPVSEHLLARQATLCEAWDGKARLDEVMAVFYPDASSPTGEELVEITAHGSPFILSRMVELCLAAGARPAQPGEFTRRAFLNGKMDLAQAEAVAALIRARSQSSHRSALAQLGGGLSAKIKQLREPLFNLLARIEVGLDHPDEDMEALAASEINTELTRAETEISSLARSFERGRMLSEGPRIALLGRPNAGKSSLLNAMIGRERAIVCPTPGTTRDTIEEPADLSGLGCVLIDTAGLREDAPDQAEQEGLRRTQQSLESCDLAVLVVDGSRKLSAQDKAHHRRVLESGRPVLRALGKSDLPRLSDFQADVEISALKREGLEKLSAEILRRIGRDTREGETLVSSLRHKEALAAAAQELGLARELLHKSPFRSEDRLAFHLQAALSRLGEIVGETSTEELLDAIFSRFCVGK